MRLGLRLLYIWIFAGSPGASAESPLPLFRRALFREQDRSLDENLKTRWLTYDPSAGERLARLSAELASWLAMIGSDDFNPYLSDYFKSYREKESDCLALSVLKSIENNLAALRGDDERYALLYSLFEGDGVFMQPDISSFLGGDHQEAQKKLVYQLKMLWAMRLTRVLYSSRGNGSLESRTAAVGKIGELLNAVENCSQVITFERLFPFVDYSAVQDLSNAKLSSDEREQSLKSVLVSTMIPEVPAHEKLEYKFHPYLGLRPVGVQPSAELMRTLMKVVPSLAFDDKERMTKTTCQQLEKALVWMHFLGLRFDQIGRSEFQISPSEFQAFAQVGMALTISDFDGVRECSVSLRMMEMLWPNSAYPSKHLTWGSKTVGYYTRYNYYKDSSALFGVKTFLIRDGDLSVTLELHKKRGTILKPRVKTSYF